MQTEQGEGGSWSTGLALLGPLPRAISIRSRRRTPGLPGVAGLAKEAAAKRVTPVLRGLQGQQDLTLLRVKRKERQGCLLVGPPPSGLACLQTLIPFSKNTVSRGGRGPGEDPPPQLGKGVSGARKLTRFIDSSRRRGHETMLASLPQHPSNEGFQGPSLLSQVPQTHLAPVAILVEASPQALDLVGIPPVPRDDGLLTDATDGSKPPGRQAGGQLSHL